MSLLLDRSALDKRRGVIAGGLQPLARSLAADLEAIITSPEIFVPREKARLTRTGGRCETDGSLLDFDPFASNQHRCLTCARVYTGDDHYRWWVMGYQLWLAERAVHAAALFAVAGDQRHAILVRDILERYVDQYLHYPNRDNVLGPSRLFFSTYLESIWLLQICVALDLLEMRSAVGTLGDRARERIIVPATSLVAQYSEGNSNRQVWNNAALLAAATLIEAPSIADRSIHGAEGLLTHLARALQSDGTWYEGENYHLFAHRGLWYGVTMAERRGEALPRDLVRRFEEGFATPFVTALPDFTFPSRRDSQYASTLRQWRTAESTELGLVRRPNDVRLAAALRELYRNDVGAGDTGRARSTAEAERNVPPARLTRGDLGWKALLFAARELPSLVDATPSSALLDGQGFAVVRRDEGRVYVALDYGTSGGGHGHPDRLNIWLVDGDSRVLEDVGTGSYVDPTLHWYRSTLAHNAPLVNGASQQRVDGRLLAYEDRGAAAWMSAAASIARGVEVRRTVVVMPDYLIDEVTWSSANVETFDLPMHLDTPLEGVGEWRSDILVGAGGTEDGFDHLQNVERADARGDAWFTARGDATLPDGWISGDITAWYRADAPGPPGSSSPRRFLVARSVAPRGTIRTVLSWRDAVSDVRAEDGIINVGMKNSERHQHERIGHLWHIGLLSNGARSSIDLGPAEPWIDEPLTLDARRSALDANPSTLDAKPSTFDAQPSVPEPRPSNTRVHRRVPRSWALSERVGELTRWGESWMGVTRLGAGIGSGPLLFALGEPHYRRSEESWEDAGRPSALVSVAATDDEIAVEISSRAGRNFAARAEQNPMDNEHPDINSDGVQLYLSSADPACARRYGWLLVPENDGTDVRVSERLREGPPLTISATWTSADDGYILLARISLDAVGGANAKELLCQVVVNLLPHGRERRGGQLVLSGGAGEWIYLRGDRENPDGFLHLTLSA